MRGVQTLTIRSKTLAYYLTLRRNITLIRGNSGTGKTTLCNEIQRSFKEGKLSPVKITSSSPIIVMPTDWRVAEVTLQNIEESILLYDEDCDYVESKEFAKLIDGSSHYHVIINRRLLKNIPYSINEVYEMRTIPEGNVNVHTLSPLYREELLYSNTNCVITEDTQSGREMFAHIFHKVLKTQGGNSTMLDVLKSLDTDLKPLLIVDGAAFGPYISDIYNSFIRERSCSLWAPDSFEYLLLKSGIVWRRDTSTILSNPSNQISSELFLTWERFFTWVVIDIMKQHPGHEYSKSKLKPWYYSKENIEKFIEVIPEKLKQYLKQ